MVITKKSLSRRTVLRGLGTTLALPLLDAMVPAMTVIAQTPAKPLRRLCVVYVSNGMAMEYWSPKKEGADFEMTPILQPLAAFRDQMVVVSGLHGHWDANHPGGCTSFLTGAAGNNGEVDIKLFGERSIDQALAEEWGKDTQLASLELALDSRGNAGQCSAGYSCVYTNTLSWRSPTMPMAGETNPRIVFERLFGDTGSTDAATRRAVSRKGLSILDSVSAKVAHLKTTVGPSDRTKVDEYLEAVRDVERRLHKIEEQSQSTIELPVMEQPEGAPAELGPHARMMFDMQVLAYQADLTRVITLMVGREQSGRSYEEIGIPEPHHPLSHHEYDPEKIARMSKINTFHTRLLAEYLEKLRATPDGDGSLLDHMMVMYGAGISDSNSHSHFNLPILLLGGASGQLKGGRHFRYPNDTPEANLLVTMMDKLGMPLDRIGDSNGRLNIETLSGL